MPSESPAATGSRTSPRQMGWLQLLPSVGRHKAYKKRPYSLTAPKMNSHHAALSTLSQRLKTQLSQAGLVGLRARTRSRSCSQDSQGPPARIVSAFSRRCLPSVPAASIASSASAWAPASHNSTGWPQHFGTPPLR